MSISYEAFECGPERGPIVPPDPMTEIDAQLIHSTPDDFKITRLTAVGLPEAVLPEVEVLVVPPAPKTEPEPEPTPKEPSAAETVVDNGAAKTRMMERLYELVHAKTPLTDASITRVLSDYPNWRYDTRRTDTGYERKLIRTMGVENDLKLYVPITIKDNPKRQVERTPRQLTITTPEVYGHDLALGLMFEWQIRKFGGVRSTPDREIKVIKLAKNNGV